MALRVCAEPGCPELVPSGRCIHHRRDREQRRGTKQQRGYDLAYDKRRLVEARKVARGDAVCWSCGQRISPLEPWDLGHCDDDRSIIHGPQHRRCNRSRTTTSCVHDTHPPRGGTRLPRGD